MLAAASGGQGGEKGCGDARGAAAAQASLSTGGVKWSDQVWGQELYGAGAEGQEEMLGPGGGGGGGRGGGGRRLPPPDGATFLSARDGAAVGGEESAALAIGVTKDAAAAAREFQRDGGAGEPRKARLSTRRLAEVLSKAGEVCAAAGKESAAEAFAANAVQLGGGGGAAAPVSTSSPAAAEEKGSLEGEGTVRRSVDPR